MPTPSLYPYLMKATQQGTVNVVEAVVITLQPDKTIEVVLEKDITIEAGTDVMLDEGVTVTVDSGTDVDVGGEDGGTKDIFTDDFDIDFD